MKNNIEGVLHMRLGEEFGTMYTDMVRQVAWYECKRDRAIVMLVSTMSGMRVDQAETIIDGKMKLETIDEGTRCQIKKDNWEPPIKEINDKKKKIKEVLSYIQFPGYTIGRPPIGGTWFEHLPEERQLYLHDMARTVFRFMNSNIWEAYNEAMRLKGVAFKDMIENSKKIGDSIISIKVTKGEGTSSSVYDGLKKEAMSRIATSDMPEELKRRLIRVTDGQVDAMQDKVTIKEDDKFEFDTGWLSTNGVYYGCKPGQHTYLADLLHKRFFPDDNQDSQKCLENNCWVTCTGKKWYYVCRELLTPEQIRAIRKWSEKWGETIMWNSEKVMVADIVRTMGKMKRW